jgi:hypothetical protein
MELGTRGGKLEDAVTPIGLKVSLFTQVRVAVQMPCECYRLNGLKSHAVQEDG